MGRGRRRHDGAWKRRHRLRGVLAPDSMFIGTATRMCENVEVTRLWHRPRHPRQKDCRWRCEGQGENELLRAADGAKFRDWIAADANPPAGGAKNIRDFA